MTAERYSRTAMILHWVLAFALAFQLSLGWLLEDVPRGPGLFTAYQLHKSVGIAILALTLWRIAIRWLHPRPPAFADSRWAGRLAGAVHAGLYAVMLGGPLTGWILVSTAAVKVPTKIFGILPWPHLPIDPAWHDPSEFLHSALAWIGVGLFLLHIAGALRHQFKGEDVVGRMIPARGAGRLGERWYALAGVALALAMLAASFAAARYLDFGSGVEARARSQAIGASAIGASAIGASAVGASPGAAPASPTVAARAANTDPTADPVVAPSPDGAARPSEWDVEPGGRLSFSAEWNGSAVPGRFRRWDARIRFGPDALDKSQIVTAVDLASADTGDEQRDETLRGETLLGVAAHPKAIFTSRSISKLGGNSYRASGTLSLHGTNRPATLTFTLKIDGDRATVSGRSEIDRTAFGVGSGEWAATDEIAAAVAVDFTFSARRRPTRP